MESAPVEPTLAWPDASNTGYRGTPVDFVGDHVCSANGETVSGKKFLSGGVKTNGKNNITVVDCWFVTTPDNALYGVNNISAYGNTPGTGLTVTHCTIDGYFVGIIGQGTFSYNDIKNIENGIVVEGITEATVIQHNYIHAFNGAVGAHYDGVEVNGNNANITIYHNRIENTEGQTSCVMINNIAGGVSNVTVNQNWLSGGTVVIYADAHFTAFPITGISITSNQLQHAAGLYLNNNGSTVTSSGNYSERGHYIDGDVPPVVGTIAFAPAPNAIAGTGDGNSTTGLRMAATLAQPIATDFRVVLYSGTTVDAQWASVWFGKQSATQVATAALQPVTFGGSAATISIYKNSYLVSDWMPKGALTFPAASVLLIGLATGTPGGTGVAGSCTNATSYFGAVGNVALANPAYGTSAGNCFALARIETR